MVIASSRSSVERGEEIVDHRGREAERRLVEQQHFGPSRSVRARSRASAARRRKAALRAGAAGRASRGKRSSIASISASLARLRKKRAEPEVVEHRELGKHLAAFRHQHQSPRDHLVRRQPSILRGQMQYRPRPGGAGPTARASASICRRRSRRAPRPSRARAPAGRCPSAPVPRRSRLRVSRPPAAAPRARQPAARGFTANAPSPR